MVSGVAPRHIEFAARVVPITRPHAISLDGGNTSPNELLRFKARDAVLADLTIGYRSKLLYMALDDMAGYKGEAWPKQVTLGKMLGVSRRTIIRWLSELGDYVTVLHRPGCAKYVLAWRGRKPIEAVTKTVTSSREGVTLVSQQIGRKCHTSSLYMNQEIEPSPLRCEKCGDFGVSDGRPCDCSEGERVRERLQRKRA